ncbi:MAG: ATP-binding protein, partial [Chloroflexota bacterium]
AYARQLSRALSCDLLVLDDFGLQPVTAQGAQDLYDIISERYERGSIILTSNRAFEEWAEPFANDLLASAALDRLTHHAHILTIRGHYTLGGERESYRPYHSRMIEPEQLWKFTRMHDYVAGDFMWTGTDYLGEARWPSKNASSGVLDLCGFPKDGYYFYQSQWTRQPVFHLCPHWTWPGREGQVIAVICYTNCESVELFLNGKSYGVKAYALPRPPMRGRDWNPQPARVHLTTADLHLAWDVPYEPGVLKAVGRREGEIVCAQEIVTAGPAAQVRLSADRSEIAADGRDVAHITAAILDEQGHLAPEADDVITFGLEGEGWLIGVDNGNPASHEPFQAAQRSAFHGLCLALVRAGRSAGDIRVTARAAGLAAHSIIIRAR